MIAKNTIFLAKKRYVAHILDMEGKLIKEGDDHEVEAKGLEIVRSSTPEVVRKWMKEAITLMLKTKSVDVVNEKIKDIQKMFKNGNISNIAKIMNVNNIEEYTDSSGKPALGCPGQVKAAIGHNLLIESNGLEDEIEKIYEGDKVKIVYIKDNPYYKFNQLAFKDNLPEKFNMANFVDYDIMWEKVFMEPMISIYDVLKWKVPNLEQEDITDLFS
jgi:DNA polymerase elongation subunit (family B)